MGRKPLWKRVSPTDAFIGLLAGFATVYLGIQTFHALTTNVTTVSAAYVTVDDAISAEGWFIRNETVAEGTSSNTVKHIVSSGEKVQDSAPLAVVYADETIMEASRRLEEVDSELTLLKSAVQSVDNYTNDTTKTEQQITRQMEQIASQVEDGTPTNGAQAANELRKLTLRRNAGNVDVGALRSQIVALESEQKSLAGKAYGRSKTITAPASGYFSEVVDGYETVLTPENISTMTPDHFQELTARKPAAQKGKLGKVIHGFTWEFATVLSKEDAARLQVGQTVTLKFSQVSDNATATVQTINADDEEALVVFSSNIVNGELVSIRQQKVDIVLGSYQGIKVPISAVTLKDSSADSNPLDNQTGVYILTGNTKRFKQIEKIYAGPDYYIVEKGNTRDDLLIGDSIVTSGVDDLKVVK